MDRSKERYIGDYIYAYVEGDFAYVRIRDAAGISNLIAISRSSLNELQDMFDMRDNQIREKRRVES